MKKGKAKGKEKAKGKNKPEIPDRGDPIPIPDPQPEPVPEGFEPQHIGGGFYELSDGSRVQGKKAAAEAQAKL